MSNHKKILAIITARGGSKGVPGKNIREVGGLPLLAWTILAANQSVYIDRLILSSDDPLIIDVAKQFGCDVPFVRPAYLAEDTSTSADVVLHAINALEEKYDLVVLLQPTSPLRTVGDIDNTIKLVQEGDALSAISVSRVEKPPEWMFEISCEGTLNPLMDNSVVPTRRQDAAELVMPNGAVYVVKVDEFIKNKQFITKNTRPYIMSEQRSIDIDTSDDLLYLEWLCGQFPEFIPSIKV